MAFKDDIARIEKRLYSLASTGVEEILRSKAKLIEKKLTELQNQFFTIMIQKVVGASGPPALGSYTPPRWKSLNTKYAATKRKQVNPGFFKNTGGLQQSLRQSRALNAFGRPSVNIGNAVTRQGKVNLDPKTRGRTRPVFIIDLYPKVEESLNNGKALARYFSPKVAYKLTNWRGREDRPIIAEYMKWWLDVKARRAVTEVLGA